MFSSIELYAIIGIGFEPISPGSKSGMLPLHYPIFLSSMSDSNTLLRFGGPKHFHMCLCCVHNCGSYESRTHSNRSTICDVSRYTNEPCNLYGPRTHITRMKILRPCHLDEQINLYRRQDSNLQLSRLWRDIQPIGMLL